MRVGSFKKLRRPNQLFERVNRIAGELNVVFLVLAVGLATLDVTFFVTQKVVERLPQVVRVVDNAAPMPDRAAPAPRN